MKQGGYTQTRARTSVTVDDRHQPMIGTRDSIKKYSSGVAREGTKLAARNITVSMGDPFTNKTHRK
jgi:hypothetical protein